MARYNKNSRSFAQAVKSILPEVDAQTEIEKVKQEQESLNKEKADSDKKSKDESEEKDEVEPEKKEAVKADPEKDVTVKAETSEKTAKSEAKKLASGIEEIVDISDEKLEELSSAPEAKSEVKEVKTGKKEGEKQTASQKKNKPAKAENVSAGIKESNMSELEKELRSSEEIVSLGEDTTFITKGTVISGNIESDGDVEVRGRVDGNIKCTGKLIISGRVTGDIDAGDLYSEEANISGEMRINGTVKIGVGSVTVGNIYAETAVVAGAVKGDMDIRDEAVLESTAIVVGNIKSKSVDISSGAIVDGFCKQAYASVDVDKYFNSQLESI